METAADVTKCDVTRWKGLLMRTTINNGACVIRAVTLGRPEPKITEKSASDNNTKQSSTAEYVFNES